MIYITPVTFDVRNIIARMISLSFLKLCFIYSLHSESYGITGDSSFLMHPISLRRRYHSLDWSNVFLLIFLK